MRVLGQLVGSLLEFGCSRQTIVASSLSGGQGLGLSKTSSLHLPHFSQILPVRSLAWVITVLIPRALNKVE